MFTFRSLEEADCAAICTFPQNPQELYFMFPAGRYPLTPVQIMEAAQNRRYPTVVLQDNRVVGYANIYGLEEGVRCFLGNVIVDPEQRGKGAATALIREMIRVARQELRVNKLELICHHTNIAGLFFYKKMGFKPSDLIPMTNHVGETIAGIMMELKLQG